MKKDFTKIEAVAIIVIIIVGVLVWGKYQIHVTDQKHKAAMEQKREQDRQAAERIAAAERRAEQRKIQEKERATAWLTADNTSMASIVVKQLVTQHLVSPSTAKFPGLLTLSGQTRKIGDRRYLVASYVDSQNRFGAMIRTKYIAEVTQVGPDNWRLTAFEAIN